MGFIFKADKNNLQVYKTDPSGKPIGESFATFNSRELAESFLVSNGVSAEDAKLVKCYDDSTYSYVPWGVSTLADALAAQDAQEDAQEIQSLGSMYKQIVDNILGNSDIKDKAKAITALADEFAGQLQDTASDTEKSINNNSDDTNTAEPADHMLIKSLGNDRVGSYAVLWGSEAKKDLTGEYFDRSTEELTSIFDTVGRLPYIYHHALDETLKTRVTGVIDVLKPDDIGLWYEAQLKMADEYDAQIKKMILDNKLKTSSQTFPGARRVSKSGHIERWPIIEISATPTPAEYRMQPVEFLKSAYAEYGMDYEAIIGRFGKDEDKAQGAVKARALLDIQRQRFISLGVI